MKPKIEHQGETVKRRLQSKSSMAKKRSLTINLQNASDAFLSKVRIGPDFVCTSCHRTMYKQNVVPCNKSKYAKASNEVLESVFCGA